MKKAAIALAAAMSVLLLAGCLTDAATRLAYDLEAASGKVGRGEGATYTLVHRVPSSRGECTGPYRVQLDKVGALIFWCMDAAGDKTVSGHSTSYHRRYVDTSQTYILEKPAKEALLIDLERRGGRIVITGAR
jgi:hypothetical protein